MTTSALLHPDVPPEAVRPFQSGNSAIKIQQRLDDSQRVNAALIFGGDGTVHRHLAQLYERQIPALVVPSGSGNDFAKALGIRNRQTALEAWRRFCTHGDNVREIDLGAITTAGGEEILFCCVAGAGMDADANARANKMPVWLKRRGGYVLAALQSLAMFKPVDMRVTAHVGKGGCRNENREISGKAFFVAIGNTRSYGGGMKVAPQAKPDDGLFDICLLARINKLKLLCWVPTIFLGRHLGLREVDYFQSDSLRIESGNPLDVFADGEFACQTPIEVSLKPRALKVIVSGFGR
ncbi:MAG TPA: diacylglycerol kinase family protein [Candidatus Angelobacter sp.]|nr:diacylglycerol kinase family protein [Candidatus Angelobacter sp.]